MSADSMRLIKQLRDEAPFSENGFLYLRAANAIEDAEARVVLAKADALNEAADDALIRGDVGKEGGRSVEGYLWARAKAIEVGEI